MLKVNNKDTRTTPMADWREEIEENSRKIDIISFHILLLSSYLKNILTIILFAWLTLDLELSLQKESITSKTDFKTITICSQKFQLTTIWF